MAYGFRNGFATMPRTVETSRRSSHPALRVAGDARAEGLGAAAQIVAGHHLVNETEPIGFAA